MWQELARCDREIASIEAELLAGGRDVEGLCRGLIDWHTEREMILAEMILEKAA
jgi:hypothetical protein